MKAHALGVKKAESKTRQDAETLSLKSESGIYVSQMLASDSLMKNSKRKSTKSTSKSFSKCYCCVETTKN